MTLVRERHHSFSIPSISILWSRANFITLMIGISLMIGLFATSTAQAQVYAGSLATVWAKGAAWSTSWIPRASTRSYMHSRVLRTTEARPTRS